MGHPHTIASADAVAGTIQKHLPRLIAWEVTRSCPLACKHCRAAARPEPYPGELSTEECRKLLDNIASFAKPIMILTGGEPMLRPDIYEIAAHANSLGLRTVMAPCGALIDDESAQRIVQSGIQHISISLDGATPASHDEFRGIPGAFEASLRGLEAAKKAGLGFQINTTITTHNIHELPEILELAVSLGASVFNPFLLVPTGRGKMLADQEISPAAYEETLHWLAGQQGRKDITIRVTCAPHYQRVIRQRKLTDTLGHPAKGCMGGQSFAFISHRGKVQICGFLDVECGDVRAEGLDFRTIWENAPIFLQMRDQGSYHGRCGHCEYGRVCGGCRARAYALSGDYLGEEPFCLYEPKLPAKGDGEKGKPAGPNLDDLDKKMLSVIQTDLPVAEEPFAVLAERLGCGVDEIMNRISRLRACGLLRRLGPIFDSRSLGYVSTLVAARVPAERLAEIAQVVTDLPGVTHNYRREHDYNLWFTLTAPSQGQLDETLADLRTRTGIADFHSLPALAVYKIRVNFQIDPERPPTDSADQAPSPRTAVELTDEQKQLVRLLQDDLPATARPFDLPAREVGWSPARVVQQVTDWMAAGVIRRFGAIVRHRQLGFKANGMAVFRLSDAKADEAGKRLAKRPEISHCYRRPPLPGFDYSLYAMVHGKDPDEVRALVQQLAAKIGDPPHTVLFSTTEYKKVSMRYFLEPTGPS